MAISRSVILKINYVFQMPWKFVPKKKQNKTCKIKDNLKKRTCVMNIYILKFS